MENDKNISSGDSYRDIMGDAKEVIKFTDDNLIEKIKKGYLQNYHSKRKKSEKFIKILS